MLFVWVLPILFIGYYIIQGFCSPLKKLPGPRYTQFTSLWIKYQEFTANRRESVHNLHQKYGPVVRLGPNEVSFTSLDAIKEIYASGGSGYDKTEFYTLFKQFKITTMFSTLNKDEVFLPLIYNKVLVSILTFHSTARENVFLRNVMP